MQFIFTGAILIVGFPIAIKLLALMISNPFLIVMAVPAGLYLTVR